MIINQISGACQTGEAIAFIVSFQVGVFNRLVQFVTKSFGIYSTCSLGDMGDVTQTGTVCSVNLQQPYKYGTGKLFQANPPFLLD